MSSVSHRSTVALKKTYLSALPICKALGAKETGNCSWMEQPFPFNGGNITNNTYTQTWSLTKCIYQRNSLTTQLYINIYAYTYVMCVHINIDINPDTSKEKNIRIALSIQQILQLQYDFTAFAWILLYRKKIFWSKHAIVPNWWIQNTYKIFVSKVFILCLPSIRKWSRILNSKRLDCRQLKT